MGRHVTNDHMVPLDALVEIEESFFPKKFFLEKSGIHQSTFNNLMRPTAPCSAENAHLIQALVDEYIIFPRAVLRKIAAAFDNEQKEITLNWTDMAHLIPLLEEFDRMREPAKLPDLSPYLAS